MSQSKIKHEFVMVKLGSMRGADKAALGGDGLKRFLEFYAGSLDTSLVRVSLTAGSFRMERDDRPEELPVLYKEMTN